jgi:hypothetical protein
MKTTDLIPKGMTLVIGLAWLSAAGGCGSPPSACPEQATPPTAATRSEKVAVTVRHIDLEGGFYGLVTEDGRNLDPVNLPKEFQQDGLRLEVRVVPLRNQTSIHMWGTQVRILEFRRL